MLSNAVYNCLGLDFLSHAGDHAVYVSDPSGRVMSGSGTPGTRADGEFHIRMDAQGETREFSGDESLSTSSR